jgi:hypothetical protein
MLVRGASLHSRSVKRVTQRTMRKHDAPNARDFSPLRPLFACSGRGAVASAPGVLWDRLLGFLGGQRPSLAAYVAMAGVCARGDRRRRALKLASLSSNGADVEWPNAFS